MVKTPIIDASRLANFLLIHVLAEAAEQELDDFRELPNLTDAKVGDLLYLVGEEMITFDSAGKIFKKMAKHDNRHPRDIADNDGHRLIKDDREVERLCRETIDKHPDKVAKARAGKHRAFGSLVAELGKAHGDRLHMANAAKVMQKLINDSN
jgi:Asp-tRNA(Asn)/Glu-tRNA(Gln) amidotransferase B subunit